MKFVFPYVEKEERWYPLIDVTLHGTKDTNHSRNLNTGSRFQKLNSEACELRAAEN